MAAGSDNVSFVSILEVRLRTRSWYLAASRTSSGTVRVLLLALLPAIAGLLIARPAHAQGREALQRAASLVQQGRLDEADKQAQLALANPETRAAACSVLGAIRFRQDRLDESVTLLEEALRLEPRLLGAHLTLAEVHSLRNRPQLALDLFQRALKLDPMNQTARFGVARLESEKGNYRASLEAAQPVLDALRMFPEGLFVLATDYLRTGDRPAASALVRHWTRLPDVPTAWSIKFALLYADEAAGAEAVAILDRAKALGPVTYELLFSLGGAHLLNGDAARALEAYDLALARKPDSLEALRQAAATAERHGELERSLSYWTRARKLAANDAEVLLGFGRVCLRMDLLEDAEPALAAAAALRPGEPAYQYTLAAAKVGKRQFDAAEQLIEPLLKARPADAQLHYALGAVLYIQGRLAEAAPRLRESVRLHPEQLASHYYLALVARDQGNDAEAIDGLQRLLRRHPAHAPSHEALGGLLMNAQRYAEAEASLRLAVRHNARSAKANHQLGLLLARMGKKEEAEKQLAFARTLRDEDEAASWLQLRLLEPER